jgi:hypothetical protein
MYHRSAERFPGRGSPHNTFPQSSWERWHAQGNFNTSSYTSNRRREADVSFAALSRLAPGFE